MTNSIEIQEINCERCSKRHNSVFCRAQNDEVNVINEAKICTTYKKGQVIFQEGTNSYGIYCINKGKIKISQNGDDGREVILRLAKPGDLIGYKAILSGKRFSATATALDEANVCFIPKELFMEVLRRDTELSMSLMALLSEELRKSEKKITHLSQKPVRERVAEALLFIKETYGFESDGITLNVRLSRDEIANIVGTATESAIRLLSEFKKDGIVGLEGKKIIILDDNKLIKRANLQD